MWLVSSYSEATEVLRDSRFGRQGFIRLLERGKADSAHLAATMLFQDPPDHTRLRALFARVFSPRLVISFRPGIQRIVDQLINRLGSLGRMNLLTDFAHPLAVYVMADVLGVPTADHGQFLRWSLDLISGRDAGLAHADMNRVAAAQDAVTHYFGDLIKRRRKVPETDLISLLIAAERGQDRLSETELLSNCTLLLTAGHETTANLIANSVFMLLQHPRDLARLREHPGLIPGAIEELVRFESPVQRLFRITNLEAEIGGKRIAKDTVISVSLGEANRDPARFPQPDRLDISRNDNPHLGFGWGPHFCLGAQLARMEVQLALHTLLQSFANLSLVNNQFEWRKSSEVRSLKGLEVLF
jgi:cytochrome P450